MRLAPLAALDALLCDAIARGESPDDLACGLRIVEGETVAEVIVSTRAALLASPGLPPSLAARVRAFPPAWGFPLLIVTARGMHLAPFRLRGGAHA